MRLPFHQIALVTLLGIASGIYIYRPLIQRYNSEHAVETGKRVDADSSDSKDTPQRTQKEKQET